MVAIPDAPSFSSPGRVYLDLYGLKEAPFSITPDPEFIFLSQTHHAALEKLQYGIDNRLGFMLLTGEVGTGKTTLCRHLLDVLSSQADTVYLVDPNLTGKELLQSILDDLGLVYPQRATRKQLVDKLHQFLLGRAPQRPVVVIVDDAQSMASDTLEQLRLLTNLETDKAKLLQIILSGQPELDTRLSAHDMRQIRQRVGIHCHLDLLGPEEVEEYITRRLYCSGNKGTLRFAPQSVALIHRHSGGIPRLINQICDYALVSGYVGNDFVISPTHVQRALQETTLIGVPVEPLPLLRRLGILLRRIF